MALATSLSNASVEASSSRTRSKSGLPLTPSFAGWSSRSRRPVSAGLTRWSKPASKARRIYPGVL
jgi:hypothetical protein